MLLTLTGSGLVFADESAESDVVSILDRHAVWGQWLQGDAQNLITMGAQESNQGAGKGESEHTKPADTKFDTAQFDSSKSNYAVSEVD